MGRLYFAAICRRAICVFLAAFLAGCADDAPQVTGVGTGLSMDVEYVPGLTVGNSQQYAVKYVCGEETNDDHPLVRAIYRTEIAVFNMDPALDVDLVWQVGYTFPHAGAGPPPSEPESEFIDPLEGFGINCFMIRELAMELEEDGELVFEGFDISLLKGFVVIRTSPHERVQVTGVYSALHKQIHGDRVADLRPVDEGNQGSGQPYCHLNEDGELVISVVNQGEGDAKPSTTTVTRPGSKVALATPALTPGEKAVLEPISVPDSGSGILTFTIEADSGMGIDESDEENNVAVGTCSGL